MGHQQWQYTQMRRIHLLHVCLPKVHFFKQATAVVPFPETLMCMHLCHIIQLVLQLTPTWHLNSLTNTLVMP